MGGTIWQTLSPVVVGYLGGMLTTAFGYWLYSRRPSRPTVYDANRAHLFWRYQKQLSCYREFFELLLSLMTESEYVQRITSTYPGLREQQDSAARHAARYCAPLLVEFGFVFGDALVQRATEVLKAVAVSRVLPDATQPAYATSVGFPSPMLIDSSLNSLQLGIIQSMRTLEKLLELPPLVSMDDSPQIEIGRGLTGRIIVAKRVAVQPAPRPLNVSFNRTGLEMVSPVLSINSAVPTPNSASVPPRAPVENSVSSSPLDYPGSTPPNPNGPEFRAR